MSKHNLKHGKTKNEIKEKRQIIFVYNILDEYSKRTRYH